MSKYALKVLAPTANTTSSFLVWQVIGTGKTWWDCRKLFDRDLCWKWKIEEYNTLN